MSTTERNEVSTTKQQKKLKPKGLLPRQTLPTFREARRSVSVRGKSFLQLIKEVKITERVQHNTDRYQSHDMERDEDDQSTLAEDILLKWTEKDLTECFTNFYKDISPLLKTLPLMIHYNSKGSILKVLVKHLRVEDQLSLEAIFEVVTAIAKDLRGEFYPNLAPLFDEIVPFISEEPEAKKNSLIFTTLAFLFKYLFKYMIEDLSSWFNKYSKLIGHKKWYIRQFAAESFAFLINKLPEKQLPTYISKIFDVLSYRASQDMFDGVSLMFFETMKSVYGHYHSRMPMTLNQLFRNMDWIEGNRLSPGQKEGELARRFTLMQKVTQLLVEHSRSKEVSTTLWKLFTTELENLIAKWHHIRNNLSHPPRRDENLRVKALGNQIGHVLALITTMISSDRDATDCVLKIVDIISEKQFVHSKQLPKVTLTAMFKFIEAVVAEPMHRKQLKNLPEIVFNLLSLDKSDGLLSFFKDILQILYGNQDEEEKKFFNEMLTFVAEKFTDSEELSLSFLLNFIDGTGRERSESIGLECDALLKHIISMIHREYKNIEAIKGATLNSLVSIESTEEAPFNVTRAWACMKCISNFEITEELFEETDIMSIFVNMFNLLSVALNQTDSPRIEIISLAADALFSLTMISSFSIDSFKAMHNMFDTVMNFLRRYAYNIHTIRAVDNYIVAYSKGELLPGTVFQTISQHLESNLHSRSAELRLYTLNLLNRFQPLHVTYNPESGQYNGPCKILTLLKDSEERGVDWEQSRQKLYELECVLQDIQRFRDRIPEEYYRLVVHYVLGGLFIKFSMVWPSLQELAKTLMSMKFSLFWDIFYPVIQEIYLEVSDMSETDESKQFIYRKEKYLKMPFVKFENYHKTFSVRSLTKLETMFSDEFAITPQAHTDVRTYLDMLWGLFEEATPLSTERPADLCKFFASFYEKQLQRYEDSDVAILIMSDQLAGIMTRFLNHLRKLRAEFLTAEENSETCQKLLTLVKKLLPTSTIHIQHLAVDCLAIFNLPWLQPYVEGLHTLIRVRQHTDALKRFYMSSIDHEHLPQLLPVMIDILEPAIMRYDVKKVKKAKRNIEQMKWQRRVNDVVKYFAYLRRNEVIVYLKAIFRRLLAVKPDTTSTSVLGIDLDATIRASRPSKLLHLLSIFQAMFDAEGGYVKFYDSILDFMLRIVEACHESLSNQMDVDEETQDSRLRKEKRKTRETEVEAIDKLATFFSIYQQYQFDTSFLTKVINALNSRLDSFDKAKRIDLFPKIFRIPFEWFKTKNLIPMVVRSGLLERFISLLGVNISVEATSTILDQITELIKKRKEEFTEVPKDQRFLQEKTVGDVLLKPITDKLIQALYELLQRNEEVKERFETAIFTIVDKLSSYFTDESPAEVILHFYGRSISTGKLSDRHADKILELFSRYLSKTTRQTREKFIKIFSTLFLSQSNPVYRKSMCDIIKNSEDSMNFTAEIIYGLNCYVASRLDRIDYSARVETFSKISEGDGMSTLSELQLYPIVTNLLFYLNDEQWAIRDGASKSLRQIVRTMAKRPELQSTELKQLVTTKVKKGATSDKVQDSNDYLPVLAEFVAFEEFKYLKPFQKVLVNLSESSAEKKLSALATFTSIALNENNSIKPEISEETVYSIFVPIFVHLILNDDRKVSKQAKQLLITLTPNISWTYGEKMINNFINMLSLSQKGNKVERRRKIALEIICDALERFPLEQLKAKPVEAEDEDVEMKEAEEEKSDIPEPEAIRKYFLRNIVPMLHNHLWDQKGEISVMKLNIAFLLIKILKHCSAEQLQRELSKVLLSLIGKLKTKKFEQQQDSQAALINILKELGSHYLHFTLQKLFDTLKEGYEIDILYGTLHALLSTVKNKMKSWNIDGAVDLILDILLRDITRPAAQTHNKKKGHKFATEQDVQDNAEFHIHGQNVLLSSFKVLAQVISFDKSIEKVVSRVDGVLQKQYNSGILKRFEEVFDNILSGLSKNPSINGESLTRFALKVVNERNLIKRSFDLAKKESYNKFQASKLFQKDPKEYYLVQPEPGRQGAIESNDEKRLHQLGANNHQYIVFFVLSLIDNSLKVQQIKNVQLLDQVVPKLIKYVSSKYMKVALVSLRVLVALQKSPNSAANSKRQEILDSILELMLNTGIDTANETWDTLFSAVRYFLDDSNKKNGAKFTEKQLDVLLDMLKIEITKAKDFNDKPFQLLLTLVEKKIQTPQIYDLMEKIKTILLKVTDERIQSLCIKMLSKFYLYYPFTPEVLQEQLNFMFKNVINEHIPFEGKIALIKMIQTIIEQFPADLINDKVEFIFCPLVLQLANERKENSVNDAETKADACLVDAIFAFLKKVNEESFRDKVMSMLCKWLKVKKLRPVAIHTCAIAARVSNGAKLKNSGTFESDFWPVIKSIIEKSSKKEEPKRSKLMLLRSSIQILLELYSHDVISHSLIDTISPAVFGIVQRTVSHFVCSVGLNLINLSLAKKLKANKIDSIELLAESLETTLQVLKRNDFQILQDLDTFSASLIKSVILAIECIKQLANSEVINQEKYQEVMEQFFQKLHEVAIKTPDQGERNASLAIQKTIILKLFAALSKKFNTQLSKYLVYMTPLLFKCTEDTTSNKNIVTPQVTELANQVKTEMKNNFNYEAFMQAYDSGKILMEDKSSQRKEKKDRRQVVDPIAVAQQNINRKKRKRESAKDSKQVKKRQKK